MASPVSQARWYRGSHDATGTHRTRLPGRPGGLPALSRVESVTHEGHAHLGGQVDERLAADVDRRPVDRAAGKWPGGLSRVVGGHRLAGVPADREPFPGDGELARLGPDPALPDRL